MDGVGSRVKPLLQLLGPQLPWQQPDGAHTPLSVCIVYCSPLLGHFYSSWRRGCQNCLTRFVRELNEGQAQYSGPARRAV